jgi:crotonobetainyl-CoA:carnitine CoA-transferase CaiB-like acyl-CoA transferase
MAGALTGLKVVELGEMVPAAYAAKLLADAGAEVIKVEPPGTGDPARRRGPFPGATPHPERSGLFLFLNTNKLGVTLDVARPEGFDLLLRLAAQADVLIHNVAPPVMDRIGLSHARLSEANPRLVMTTIAPFGLSGPCRNWRAEDFTLWSAGGAAYLNGWPGRPDMPPLKTFGHQAGLQTGAHAALATMAALVGRLRGAPGQHVEVSGQEVIAAILEMNFAYWPYAGLVAARYGQRPIQPLDFLECRDGWIFLCCVEEHQWRAFVEVMGSPEWAGEEIFSDRLKRAAHWDALKPLIEPWVREHAVEELYRKAQARRIPFAPVSTMGTLLGSDHLKARGFFVEVRHPEAGALKHPGPPARYSRTPWELRMPAPALGQHNSEVYGTRLGLPASRLRDLAQAGAI